MLESISTRNFKGWKDTGDLRLSPLTGLFGTNSSGKTSLLQLLLMLKQTAASPDRKRVIHTGDAESPVDLGTFYDLIYRHDPNLPLDIRLSWTLPEPLRIKDPEAQNRILFEINRLQFQTGIRQISDQIRVEDFRYTWPKHEFGMKRSSKQPTKGREAYDLLSGGFSEKRVPGRAWPLPAPVKCYGFPDEATGYYQNTGFLPDLVLAFEHMLQHVYYLGPLRDYPKRSYVWAGERPVDVGRKGEQAVAALLAARAEGMQSGRGEGKGRRYKSVEERIAEWLREMDMIHSFSLRPIARNRKDYEVRVRKTANSPQVLITDVGFGVSQILPVLVLCYYVPEDSTIVLEQPEIHLHPFVQAVLADVFIDVIINRRVQIIVESHSEHLLRRLQRRIAEEKLTNDRASLYFCTATEGELDVKALDLNIYGEISNWPPNFFGDELGDLKAMTLKRVERSKSA